MAGQPLRHLPGIFPGQDPPDPGGPDREPGGRFLDAEPLGLDGLFDDSGCLNSPTLHLGFLLLVVKVKVFFYVLIIKAKCR